MVVREDTRINRTKLPAPCIESFFAGKRIAALDPAEITAYVKKRQAEGMSFPTPFRIPGVGTEVNARKISGEPGIPRV
jgi:hypothetical protein